MIFPRLCSGLLLVLAAFLANVPGCRGREEDAHVVTDGPTGGVRLLGFTQEGQGQPGGAQSWRLVARFDQPVIDGAQVGAVLQDMPVAIEPAQPWLAHFSDRQTLVLRPTQTLAAATRYDVRWHGDFIERLGQREVVYSFVHDPLVLRDVVGLGQGVLVPGGQMGLNFSQAVAVDEVARACKLINAQGEEVAIRMAAPADQASGNTVEVAVVGALLEGEKVTLRCENLHSLHGNAPAQVQERVLEVRPAFALRHHEVGVNGNLEPDDLRMEMHFSTAVDGAALTKSVRIEPPIVGFAEALGQVGGSKEVRFFVQAAANTTYTLTIDAALTDSFGRALGTSVSTSFTTTFASPRLRVPTGVRVIERQSGGLPILTRSVEKVDVECSSLTRASALAALTGDAAWSSYDPKQAKAAWRKLIASAHKHQLQAKSEQSEWRQAKVDLLGQCMNPGDVPVILARVSSPELREAPSWNYPYSVLANPTDLGVLLKAGASGGVVWVTSLLSGKPVAGANVAIYYGKLGEVFRGLSDSSGLVRIPGVGELEERESKRHGGANQADEDEWGSQPRKMVAWVEVADDVAVVAGDWNDGIAAWNFAVNNDWQRQSVRTRVLLLSDRGIYRPGETVNFRGIVREMRGDGPLRVPSKAQVKWALEDPRGRIQAEKTATLSRFGGFSLNQALSSQAVLGDWILRAQVNGETFTERISVQAFRPQTFELLDESTGLRDEAAFRLRANYLTGTPVDGAPATWQVSSRPTWLTFAEFEEFIFDPSDPNRQGWGSWWGDDESDSYETALGDGKLTTDAQGQVSFAVRVPPQTFPLDLVAQLEVTDRTGQSVSKRVVKTHHPVSFYLGVRPESWLATAGEPAVFHVVAVDPQGKPTASEVNVVLSQRKWTCKANPHGCEVTLREVSRSTASIAADKPSAIRIVAPEGGDYVLHLQSKDRRGRVTQGHIDFWATGTYNGEFGDWEDRSFHLGLNKRRFAPGERAKVALATALVDRTVLMTSERSGVLDAWVVDGNAAQKGIDVALTAAHAPNVFISATVVSGRRGPSEDQAPDLRMGVVEIPVTSGDERLVVDVRTEQKVYLPGDRVRGEVIVKSGGQGVRAEVSLSVADEGVLALVGYRTPDPRQLFGAAWPRALGDAANYVRLLKMSHVQDPEEEGMDGASDGQGSSRIRTQFVSSAYWQPALVTDAQGKATFEFVAPDNLTAFRMMAVAADEGVRFGTHESRILVRKNLQAMPMAPRFLTEGDVVDVGAAIINRTDQAGRAEVAIEAVSRPPAQLTPASQSHQLNLAAQATGRASMSTKVGAADNMRLTVRASLASERDAFAIDVPVTPATTPEVRSLFEGPLKKEERLDLAVPIDVRRGQSTLEIRADTVGLAQVSEGLAYLVGYPYGCLEQTISKVLPMAGLHELLDEFALPTVSEATLDGHLQTGIAKIARHQATTGHFSLWPDSEPEPHLTAYALFALREVERAGFAVPPDVVQQGLAALKRWVGENSGSIASSHSGAELAMAAYVLALHNRGDLGLLAKLDDNRKVLAPWGQVFVLRGLLAASQPERAAAVAAELRDQLRASANGGLVLEEGPPRDYDWGSSARTTALLLSAMVAAKADDDLLQKLARGLLSLRQGPRWETTQDNLYALLAIADLARYMRGAQGKVTVVAGDRALGELQLSGMTPQSLVVPLDTILAPHLTLRVSGQAVVSAFVRLQRNLPRDTRLSRDLEVSRLYLDPKSGKEITQAKAGDLVLVRVVVHAQRDQSYIAIRDPLPAGLEPVLLDSVASLGNANDEGWWWTHAEDHDSHGDIFADALRAGSHVHERYVRATSSGTFSALPTTVEAMYDAQPFARGTTQTFTVVANP